ncbi:MAG: hypothetical protein JWL63_2758 [Rhodocyclales bacterium]|nr:hypothetical protein [Rhodocyclales bacterium]
MKVLFALIALVAMGVIPSAHAEVKHTETNKTLTEVGVNAEYEFAYFFLAEGIQLATCGNGGGVFIAMDAAGMGKLLYGTVLTAKVTGKKISYL